jgi:GNAT superfamily N-acetyltransferase
MIIIKEVGQSDSEAYLNSLKKLIDETIDLPQKAKDSLKNQWNFESINRQIGSWLFLVAADDANSINGLILGTSIEGGVGTIVWLLVDRNLQQKGLGTKLFEAAKVWYKLKGAHKIKLTVPDKSTVGFYLKQGMTLEGEHLDHWWNHNFWSMGVIL